MKCFITKSEMNCTFCNGKELVQVKNVIKTICYKIPILAAYILLSYFSLDIRLDTPPLAAWL